MFELKMLSSEAIPAALSKAERYRLLNEPGEAESICLDVLNVDPENRQALVVLLLALTDQFHHGHGGHGDVVTRARAVLPRLGNDYEHAYYEGIICERRAKALIEQGPPGFGAMAYDWFREAMHCYEKAEAIRPPGNDDAVLRWNACARLLDQHPHLKPRGEEAFEPLLLE